MSVLNQQKRHGRIELTVHLLHENPRRPAADCALRCTGQCAGDVCSTPFIALLAADCGRLQLLRRGGFSRPDRARVCQTECSVKNKWTSAKALRRQSRRRTFFGWLFDHSVSRVNAYRQSYRPATKSDCRGPNPTVSDQTIRLNPTPAHKNAQLSHQNPIARDQSGGRIGPRSVPAPVVEALGFSITFFSFTGSLHSLHREIGGPVVGLGDVHCRCDAQTHVIVLHVHVRVCTPARNNKSAQNIFFFECKTHRSRCRAGFRVRGVRHSWRYLLPKMSVTRLGPSRDRNATRCILSDSPSSSSFLLAITFNQSITKKRENKAFKSLAMIL